MDMSRLLEGFHSKEIVQRVFFFSLLALLSFAPSSRAQHVSTLSTGITTTGTYSDNIDASSSNPQSGFYSEISPWLRYNREGKKSQLGVSYDPSFRYYFEDQDHFIGQRLGVTASRLLSERLTARFSNSFQVSDDPYDIPESGFVRIDESGFIVIEDPTIRTGRRTYYSNNLRQSFDYRFGPSNRFNAGYSFGFLKNDDPSYEDNMRHSPDLSLEYWWNAQYGTVIDASYTRGEFDDSPSLNDWSANARFLKRLSPQLKVFVEHGQTYVRYDGQDDPGNGRGDQRNFEVFDGNLGFDYELSPTTFLALKGGYFYQQVQGGDSASGFQIDGDMARQFKRGSVRASGGTGYDQNFFGAENLGFTKYYRGRILGQYAFTRRCSGNASLQYQHNTYEAEDRDDDTYTLSSGISYVFRPWLTGSLSYVFRMVDSTEAGDDYTENRVSFSLTAAPTLPFRFD